jgi:hypothetical protein
MSLSGPASPRASDRNSTTACSRGAIVKSCVLGSESGGVLQDSVGEDSSFENKSDLVTRVQPPPTSAGCVLPASLRGVGRLIC